MLKTILNLDGAHELNKKEQNAISGGKHLHCCDPILECCVPHAPGEPASEHCEVPLGQLDSCSFWHSNLCCV